MRKSRAYSFQLADRGRTEARLSTSESFQDSHCTTTSGTPPERRRGWRGCFGRRRRRIVCAGHEREAQRQEGRAAPMGEEPEVADAHKSRGQNMQEEAAQELFQRQLHQALLNSYGLS